MLGSIYNKVIINNKNSINTLSVIDSQMKAPSNIRRRQNIHGDMMRRGEHQ